MTAPTHDARAALRAWALVWGLAVALMAITSVQSLSRYEAFGSGLSWDLAYYNQWCWAMTRGDGQITVRPGSAYAMEGPSVWRMNYLAPIRFALLPVYALFPDPRTLLVLNTVIFWGAIPAAFALVRAESGSSRLALAATALVPLTPLAWLLAVNDFRELQLALPFALCAVHGWRHRHRAVAALGIGGLLACRQEYALLVMSLALVPAHQPEPAARRRSWTMAVLATGTAWGVLFLAYLASRVDPHAPTNYLVQFIAPSVTFTETSRRALDILSVGLASWACLALFAPCIAVLAIPWLWILSRHWDLHDVATSGWHHVRYAAPLTAILLAAGLVGFARAGLTLARVSRIAVAGLWTMAAVGLVAQHVVLQQRFAQVPAVMSPGEAARLWSLIGEVQPHDAVLAAYSVAAPLSSRHHVYDYARVENQPRGYPRLAPEIRWAFVEAGDVPEAVFLAQGFDKVHAGPSFLVFRRARGAGTRGSGP